MGIEELEIKKMTFRKRVKWISAEWMEEKIKVFSDLCHDCSRRPESDDESKTLLNKVLCCFNNAL